MMKIMSILSFILAICVTYGYADRDTTAQKTDTAVQAAGAKKQGPETAAAAPGSPEAMRTALLDLRSDLKATFQKYSPRDLNTVNAYMNALSRIEVTHQFLLENFKSEEGKQSLSSLMGASAKKKEAREMFEACSLLVEIAYLQMSKNEQEGGILEASRKSDSIHTELAQVYESIVNIERGRASQLKAKLEEENAKNQQMREEAERRFRELQSELIKVRKDARGTIISMSDLLFAFDKADLTGDLKTALAKIAGILSVYKKFNVLVEGHTDNIGTAEYNKDLSTRRASNVRDYLVAQGIAAARLSSAGYGFSKPVATNSTKEGRQKNRRVDLVVVEKK